jgi:hypothetical protein
MAFVAHANTCCKVRHVPMASFATSATSTTLCSSHQFFHAMQQILTIMKHLRQSMTKQQYTTRFALFQMAYHGRLPLFVCGCDEFMLSY